MIQRRSKSWNDWLSLIGWGVAALCILGLIMEVGELSGVMFVVGYSFLFLILILATWSQADRIARRRRALDVLGYIEQAVILNIPIPVALMAAEQSEKGIIAWRLEKLRILIDAGESLGQALADSMPEMPRAMVGQISMAERLGQLPEVLRWLRRPRLRALSPRPEQTAFNVAYLPAMLLAVTAVAGMAAGPQVVKLLRDFKVSLPWTTRVLIETFRQGWIFWPVGIYVLIRIGRIMASIFEPGDRYFGKIVDVVKWHIPVLHGKLQDQAMSGLCRTIAGAAAAGWPLAAALREAVETQSNAVPRDRILRWANGVESGLSVQEAARAAKMPRLMVGMLGPVRSGDDLAQVMSFLARHYESRFDRAEIIFQAAYIPAVVGLMGLVVAFVAVGLMMPLIMLINVMSPHAPGFVR